MSAFIYSLRRRLLQFLLLGLIFILYRPYAFAQCYNGDCETGYSTFHKPDYKGVKGYTYTGTFLKGRIIGKGTIWFPDSSYYEGQVLDGLMTGYGKLYNKSDKLIKEGLWLKDKYIGKPAHQGKCISGDCKNGYGAWVAKNNESFAGQFKAGSISYGAYTWPDGDSYIGSWKNVKPNGEGVFFYKTADLYIGQMVGGKRQGQGTLIAINGMRYVGGFENDLRDGFGTLYDVNGTVYYKGNWRNNFGADYVKKQVAIAEPEPQILVIKQYNNFGAINEKGEIKITIKYDGLSDFVNGVAAAGFEGKWGYIDTNEKTIIPFNFSYTTAFGPDGYAAVQQNGKWGLIDRSGKFVMQPTYDDTLLCTEGLCRVKNGERYGFITMDGKQAIEPTWKWVSGFHNGLCVVQRIGLQFGVINKKGDYVVPGDFDELSIAPVDSIVRVKQFGKYGYYSIKGKQITACVFADAGDFSEGLAPISYLVGQFRQYGYITKNGKLAFRTPKYNYLKEMHQDMAAAGEYKNLGYINRFGQVVMEPQFEDAGDFHEDYAKIALKDKYGYLNNGGHIIVPPQFDEVGDFHKGLAWAVKGDMVGYINKHAKFIYSWKKIQ